MNGLTVLLILLALAVGWWAHAIGKEIMDRLFGIGSADQIVFVPEDWINAASDSADPGPHVRIVGRTPYNSEHES